MGTEFHFEWDPSKAANNLNKHQVAFDEAATIFDDPIFITFVDKEHSTDEERYITIGLSRQGRLLVVAHTEREGKIRIISARKATKKEGQVYAELE
ncbi:MAG: BrnT family toxin [Chloroflexi bacterium]|nr:BrnT family toxin [Chloroflexota bacterium]